VLAFLQKKTKVFADIEI